MSPVTCTVVAPGSDGPKALFRIPMRILPPVYTLIFCRGSSWRVTGYQFRIKTPTENVGSTLPPWSAVEDVVVMVVKCDAIPTEVQPNDPSEAPGVDVSDGIAPWKVVPNAG